MFASAFMTFCIYQRFFLSPEDSLFCAHFLKLLHKIKVPEFPTIELIDIIVDAVVGSLYCMTEDEAGNMSIFLNEIWKSVNSWRYDNDEFASELKDTVSFSTAYCTEYSMFATILTICGTCLFSLALNYRKNLLRKMGSNIVVSPMMIISLSTVNGTRSLALPLLVALNQPNTCTPVLPSLF